MAKKYVDAKTFDDFSRNQELMIQTFNHNITTLTDAVVRIEISFAELLGGQKVLKKVVYWILGIIGAVIVAGVVGNFMNPV